MKSNLALYNKYNKNNEVKTSKEKLLSNLNVRKLEAVTV